MIPKTCSYPDCLNCEHTECIMEGKDINALLKRKRWKENPDYYREKQRKYRAKIRDSLPHCDECEECVLIKNDKGDGFRRLCAIEMRLIERKVTNCPIWCSKRMSRKERDHQRYLRRKEAGVFAKNRKEAV